MDGIVGRRDVPDYENSLQHGRHRVRGGGSSAEADNGARESFSLGRGLGTRLQRAGGAASLGRLPVLFGRAQAGGLARTGQKVGSILAAAALVGGYGGSST